MNIVVSGHGMEVTPALKAHCIKYTEDKLNSVVGNPVEARWTLSVESSQHRIHLHWKHGKHSGDVQSSTHDMYESVVEAAKKASSQLKSSVEKVRGR